MIESHKLSCYVLKTSIQRHFVGSKFRSFFGLVWSFSIEALCGCMKCNFQIMLSHKRDDRSPLWTFISNAWKQWINTDETINTRTNEVSFSVVQWKLKNWKYFHIFFHTFSWCCWMRAVNNKVFVLQEPGPRPHPCSRCCKIRSKTFPHCFSSTALWATCISTISPELNHALVTFRRLVNVTSSSPLSLGAAHRRLSDCRVWKRVKYTSSSVPCRSLSGDVCTDSSILGFISEFCIWFKQPLTPVLHDVCIDCT